jgi:LemA protein
MLGYIVYLLGAVIVLWGLWVYNKLVRLRNMAQEAWSDIDTQLKRRHDLIPNLVSTVKGYAQYERNLLEQITQARAKAQSAQTFSEKTNTEGMLSSALKSFLAVAEAYPDLKANESFLELHRNLAQVEDEIQKSRRYYNAVVRDLNTAIEVVPNNLIAQAFGFQRRSFFELDSATESQTPGVKLS